MSDVAQAKRQHNIFIATNQNVTPAAVISVHGELYFGLHLIILLVVYLFRL